MQQRRLSQSSMPRVASLSDDIGQTAVEATMFPPQCQRMGIMASFANMEAFENSFEDLMSRFSSPPGSPHLSDMDYTDMMKEKVSAVLQCSSLVVPKPRLVFYVYLELAQSLTGI